jgi:hypothetical protein
MDDTALIHLEYLEQGMTCVYDGALCIHIVGITYTKRRKL